MNDIDIYNNRMEILERKESNVFNKFLLFIIILIIFLTGICFINYPKIYHFEGVANDNRIVLYLEKDSLSKLKGNTLKIKDNDIYYEIESITKLDNEINIIDYYSVKLFVQKKLIDNDMIDIEIKDGNTNFYKEFIKRIWRGFNNE